MEAVKRIDSIFASDDTINNFRQEFVVARVREMQRSVLTRDMPARVGDSYQGKDPNGNPMELYHTIESIVGAKIPITLWNVQCQLETGELLKRELVLETAIDPKLRAKAVENTVANTKVQLAYRVRTLEEDTPSVHPDKNGVIHTYAAGSEFRTIRKIDTIDEPVYILSNNIR